MRSRRAGGASSPGGVPSASRTRRRTSSRAVLIVVPGWSDARALEKNLSPRRPERLQEHFARGLGTGVRELRIYRVKARQFDKDIVGTRQVHDRLELLTKLSRCPVGHDGARDDSRSRPSYESSRQGPNRSASGLSSGQPVMAADDALSYTHLRAHET